MKSDPQMEKKEQMSNDSFLTKESAEQLAEEIRQMGIELQATTHSNGWTFQVVVYGSGESGGICVTSRHHWNEIMVIFKAIIRKQLKV